MALGCQLTGLPPPSHRAIRDLLGACPPCPQLVCLSAHLMPRPRDWHESVQIVGPLRVAPRHAAAAKPSAALLAFVEAATAAAHGPGTGLGSQAFVWSGVFSPLFNSFSDIQASFPSVHRETVPGSS